MHTIEFASPYKSLFRFTATELPQFVVLTGRNGSGKSHLLEALAAGKIRSSLAPNPPSDIKLFTATSIIPTDTGRFDPAQEQSQRSQWFTSMESHREACFPALQGFLLSQGAPKESCSNLRKIVDLNEEKLKEILPQPEQANTVMQQLKSQLQAQASHVFSQSHNQIGDPQWRLAAPKVLASKPEAFLIASQSKFFDHNDFVWGVVDPFQQAFGRIFANYRGLIHTNDLLEKYPPPDDLTRKYLSPAEFEKCYGPAPWNFVNQVLQECKLDFSLNAPPMHETVSYEPKLTKLSADVEMRFQDLSSGEKVLMSFALCLYNSQESRQTKVFPKLLLLDEVDGPLHPSMTLSLLKTIQNVLVRDQGVSVILTTHSPSTVALAPEDSIYSMNPRGPNLEKVTKSAALLILTAGVPTLSVSFDGRRQVLVESRTDAKIYDSLFQKYKDHLASERSLVFLEVGQNRIGLEQDSGCAKVIQLVKSLGAGGNQSVLGLVDWDGHREPNKRIHVLSHGIRNGIESLLLDPRLLIAVVSREQITTAQSMGILEAGDTYASIRLWSKARWQRAVDKLQTILLGCTCDEKERITIFYLDEITIDICKDYLHLDDHELESRVLKAFAFLKAKNKHSGDLMSYIVTAVLSDTPGFLPLDLIQTFNALLSVEIVKDSDDIIEVTNMTQGQV